MILIWLKLEKILWTQTLEVDSESRSRGEESDGQIRFSLQRDPNVSCQQLAVILGTDSIKHPKLRMSGFQSSHFQICKLSFTEALIVTVWGTLVQIRHVLAAAASITA